MKKSLSFASIMLTIALGFFVLACDSTPKLEYVTIDINPSIDMVLDRNNHVVTASALNADGEVLLLNLALEEKPVDEAIDEIIDEAIDLGYIDPDTEDTVVEIGCENEQVRERVRENVNKSFQNKGVYGKAIAQENKDLIAEAESLGVTVGFLRMATRAVEADDSLTLEVALTMDKQKLVQVIKDKNAEMKMIVTELKTQFFEERELLKDEYLPQIQALEAEIAAIEAEDGDASEKIAELDLLREEFHTAMTELRQAYQADGAAYRTEKQQENQNRKQMHQAEVEAFRNQMQQRSRNRRSQIEDYQDEETTEPDVTTEPVITTEPDVTTEHSNSEQGTGGNNG